VLCEDNSDTWSHDIDSYDGIELGRFTVTKSHVRETGPIRSSIELEADCLASRLAAKCSIYRNRPWIDLEIDLSFLERFTIAKLNIPIASSQGRLDGIATGMLQRAQDSKEFPFMDWTLAVREEKKNGPTGFGVVSTDCFAFDGSDSLLRFTLVRSPVFAWHQPTRIVPERIYRHTDQGDHRFLFRLFPSASQGELERHADWLHQPPMLFDWTRGM
jgi:alpha-mannosidase